MANNPQSAQKITEISSNLNKSFAGSINEQLAKFETQTPKDSFKNSFNQVKQDYADTKDFLVKNSNYQSDFKDLNENLATILNDTQNINTRGVFNALNGGGNLENLLNAKNAINEQLSYIMRADFKSSSDFINQKALSEAKSLIDNEINTALKNDENLINLYKSANGDYATMKNIVDSNLMSQISRDGKTSLEALNAMIKSNENINGVTLNDFLSSLGAKDRAIAEANIIKNLMEKNSVNGVVDFRALNQSLNSLDFGSEFAKELRSQILNRQALLNNTSDILNALGNKVVKSKSMSQGISTDPLKRAETMKANLIIEKIKPLIPKLGNNEALKLHLNRAILNANGDFKLAIKNIDNIPDGNLPTPTRNLLNEFKEVVKEIEKQVVKTDNQPNLSNQANNANIDSLTKQISYLQNALQNSTKDAPTPSPIKQEADSLSEATPNLTQNSIKGDGFVTYPNSAKQIYPHSAIFEVPNEIRQIADIGDRVSASLEWLRSNHPEMFKTQRAVKEVIDYVLKEPENIVSPKKGDGVILSKQNDKKMDEIGINQNSEVFHANKRKLNSNEKKAVSGDALPPHLDADNTSLTGRYSVGGKPHLTAFNENIIPQNAKNEVKEQAKIKQINEQTAKAKSKPKATAAKDPTAEQPKWANKLKTKMAKMGQEYNDEKIANLANWHKDSHAVTKESDGSPKVFYHGTNAKFNAFDIDKSKGGWLGKSFYFTDSKGKAKGYGKNVISTYLNLKNPFISKANDHYKFINEVKEQFGVKENYGEFDPAQVLKQHGYDGVVYKDWDDEVGTIYTAFSPNQIKSISNKGTFNPNSKMMDGFSTMAIQKAILNLGSGGIGGVMNANTEQDPNKKTEAFVKGFLLGAGGSVGAIKMLENSAKLAKLAKD